MAAVERNFNSPGYFPFPFPPYDIQEDFMKQLYKVLEGETVGIFESPTGTGKSLSLICGALTWLKDYEEKQKADILQKLSSSDQRKKENQHSRSCKADDEPDWVTEFAEKQARREEEDKLKEMQTKLERQQAHLEKVKSEIRPAFVVKGKRKHSEGVDYEKNNESEGKIQSEIDELLGKSQVEDPDADLVVSEYHSDSEADPQTQDDKDEEEEVHTTKIYYCSRTHSQLAQFVREVQKSPFGNETRVVTLGSRQNLCINEDIRGLRNINRINEMCLDLQKQKKEKKTMDGEKVTKKKKTAHGCPFYDHKQLEKFKDLTLVDIKDIEQLVSAGQELKACPYYGTRYAVPQAQLVVLPYNLLLHQSTRKACGIRLEGNIVIIDEAHNLIDTITNIYSAEVSGAQLLRASSQLSQYRERYSSRLKAKNLMYIKQILYILNCLINCLRGKLDTNNTRPTPEVKLQTINDFLFMTNIDNVNLFKIQRYCERSMISKKLNGFVDKYQECISDKGEVNSNSEEGEGTVYLSTSPLQHIESFLQALNNADKDGRIVVNKQERLSTSSLKFMLLNPAVHFTSVVKESRAVVIAGGTMQPTSVFKEQLFSAAEVSADSIIEFSCGHVIPDEHLLVVALDKGPSGVQLDFTYQARESPQLLEELGRVLSNICAVVPGGVVCFFPSYDYEQRVHTYWQKAGIIDRINNRKKIFREPRKASQVDQVLNSFSSCIRLSSSHMTAAGGAVLLCVVGGKMSEGINFSDDLGRCVVMVGLPYPNVRSPELKEKMDYLNLTLGNGAGQTHYENLCMKAVNQSIGRAIRHKRDYATILLLDHRYKEARVHRKLPSWISNRLQRHERFGKAFAAVRKFFVDKRSSQEVPVQHISPTGCDQDTNH